MVNSKVYFFLLCTICATTVIESEFLRESKPGMLIRQKKKVVAIKKPPRHHERTHGRQGNFHRSALSSPDEYSVVYTSENPNGNWKPVAYASVENVPQTTKSKPIEANAAALDDKLEQIERRKQGENEQPSPSQTQHEQTGEQFEDYALLHYYIPFDQLITQNSKPITEIMADSPQKPLTIEQIMTAAVEPVAMFQLDTTKTTTTSTPATITSTAAPPPPPPPPSSTYATTTERTARESDPQQKEDEFTGRYEYEYFVHDNHWGTNFGHKEFRDGKQTKGDYEVVLPDGRVQHVQYWSDATGYHASVTYHPLYKKYKQ